MAAGESAAAKVIADFVALELEHSKGHVDAESTL